MFRLLRYFSVTSLLAFAIVTVLLGILYRQTAVNDLIEMEETKNVVLTKSLANSLWPVLVPYLDTSVGLSADELRSRPEITELSWSIVSQIMGLSVVKIKVYNLQGTTVYSTEASQIGEYAGDNDGVYAALRGEILSELTHRDSFNAYDGVIEDQDVVFTYTPVYSDGPVGDIQGVIELYSNVTPFLDRIDKVQRNIVFGVASILALLYLSLFLIVRRADLIIRRQHDQRIEAEERLRQEHRAVVILKEREQLARELHDSLGQVLGYVKMQSQAALEYLHQGNVENSQNHLRRLIDSVQNAHVDVREYILNLQSGINENQTFVDALEEHTRRFTKLSDVPVELIVPANADQIKLPLAVESQLIRIVQESLANIRKHAQATTVKVDYTVSAEAFCIKITDNGRGFDPANVATDNGHHFGMGIMDERAREVNGHLNLYSTLGEGTTVEICAPLSTKEAVSELLTLHESQ